MKEWQRIPLRLCIMVFTMVCITLSCKQERPTTVRTETLEIYNTAGDEANKVVDSLQYYESTEYVNERKRSISYYDYTGQLTGKLTYEYINDQLVSGRFVDKSGSLLSYYDFITNKKGDLIAEYGFNATNDELLSIKAYEYYADGSIKTRRLINSNHQLEREYRFSYDNKGNEIAKQVYDGDMNEIMTETFNISSVDSSGRWTQRWGMVNQEPYTFYKRS